MSAEKAGLVGVNSLSKLSDISSALPLDVSYCLALPWLLLFVAPASGKPSLFTSAHASTANKLDAANQGVCNGHSL